MSSKNHTYVRSAKMLRKQLRGRKIQISQSMDAEERFHQKSWDTSHRTKARVAWNVVLYCSNLASICSHALIFLSPTCWIVMTGWRTSISQQPFQIRLNCGSWSAYTHQSPALVFQTRLDGVSLFVHNHLSPALCFSSPVFKHVWIMVPCL